MSTIEKITAADLEGKGVTPLPDVPEMTSEQLKYKFEEIVRDVAIAKINEIIDAIYAGGLPVATRNAIGGVKAAPAESSDVQPVRIGEDGVLYTAGGSGGEYHVDDEFSEESRYPVQNRVITEALQGLTRRLYGSGAPTSSTVGRIGDLYTDITTGKTYNCIYIADDIYVWQEFARPMTVYTVYDSGSAVADNSLYEITASTAFTIALGSVDIVRGVHFVVTTASAITLSGITSDATLKINDPDRWLETASNIGDVYEVSILKDVVLIKRTYKAV